MYVKNSEQVDIEKFYCGVVVAEYLIYKCGIPLFGKESGKFVFVMTDKFKEEWKNAPLYIKTMQKIIG